MKLDKKISSCLSFVKADTKHDLPLYMRRDLLSCLGQTGKTVDRELERARKVLLSCLAIKKVLPLWEAHFQDPLALDALHISHALLLSKFDPDEAHELSATYWDRCDNLGADFEGEPNILMAGYGAAQTILLALNGDTLSEVDVKDKITDYDLEPHDLDPSFLACAAYAHGAVWDDDSDASKRLEFWIWWLQTVKEVSKS